MSTKLDEIIEYTLADVLALIAKRTFTEFTTVDWFSWSGVESDTPLISYGESDDDLIIVLDNDTIILADSNGNEEYFRITVEN